MRKILTLLSILSFSFTAFATTTPEETAATKRVLSCSSSGEINEGTLDSYYDLAEKGKISTKQAVAISKIINKVSNCREIQIILETVVASK